MSKLFDKFKKREKKSKLSSSANLRREERKMKNESPEEKGSIKEETEIEESVKAEPKEIKDLAKELDVVPSVVCGGCGKLFNLDSPSVLILKGTLQFGMNADMIIDASKKPMAICRACIEDFTSQRSKGENSEQEEEAESELKSELVQDGKSVKMICSYCGRTKKLSSNFLGVLCNACKQGKFKVVPEELKGTVATDGVDEDKPPEDVHEDGKDYPGDIDDDS